jgi:transcription initiation factor TFIIIB Brf1 subunit/transcription initiation factor TFIIB
LSKIKYCFSPGVGPSTSFENKLKKYNIISFLADGTVLDPSNDSIKYDFIKKNLNTFNDNKNITLEKWIKSKLNINSELTKLCQFIAIKIEKKNMMPENTPHSIAAGVVYFISQLCKLNVSKKDVKIISEISEVTINKIHKKLELFQDELVPAVILEKYK